jgi:hypothetical protein
MSYSYSKHIPLGMPKRQARPYLPRLEAIEARVAQQTKAEYSEDILAHIRKMQQITMADANLMDLQPEVEWHMRPYLLDFLIDSHLSLRLQPSTLFLAVNLIDRYCSKRVVFKKHYQLVGCTALWIASKYQDKKSRIPTITDLKQLCCGAYEEDMFVQMEGHVLNTLDWTVGHPTIDAFLDFFLDEEEAVIDANTGANNDVVIKHVARYICEQALFHRSFIGFEPCSIANAAHKLAMHIVGYSPSIATSSVNQQDLQCITLLCQHIKTPSKSLQRKYSSSSLSHASQLVVNYFTRQQQQQQQAAAAAAQQHIHMPPTPPPASFGNSKMFTPPSLSGSQGSPSVYSDSPTFAGVGVGIGDMQHHHHIGVNPSFKHGEGYLTPPCTPAEMAANGMVPQVMMVNGKGVYRSVAMEYSYSHVAH